MHETIVDKDKDILITAGMLADRLRPLVLASCDGPPPNRFGSSCLNGTPMIPLHRATLGAIYQHLERIAVWDNERTILSLEQEIYSLEKGQSDRLEEAKEKLAAREKAAMDPIDPIASGIEARSDATPKSGAAEGESPAPSGETPQ